MPDPGDGPWGVGGRIKKKSLFSELIKKGCFPDILCFASNPAPGTVAGIYDGKLRPLFEDSGEKSGTSAGSREAV